MRFLTDADVAALLPTPLETVALAREALVARASGDVEVPPKPAVHTVPGSFANAMPAAWPARNLLGCKWITIFPDNPAAGLPTADGLMVVNDGATGRTRCVMQAGVLTAARTAAVSGACVQALAPAGAAVAVTGAGVQARSHLRVLAALGHTDVRVYSRREEARQELHEWAAGEVPEVHLRCTDDPERAVRGAVVVVTALGIGVQGAHLDPSWVSPDALLLPLDYATSVGPDLATGAVLVADDVDQFEAVRATGRLGSYPAPGDWTGALLGRGRPAHGRVVCQNLGNGLSDLVVASAVADAAEASGAGHLLDTEGT
ncbi:ornithine cyclodeaminase family protein [Phycicoccus sp. M110.8]|uniref:ornithine cyclodeaminase family protein n=1 Tax=Phycicoccus sp. M110.8 TaxID=3075433 RepID=UPI0028FD271A|nr:ornithine cyclodeaminase family protein [Phycicoccus sp. M110.8]MDU0312207.1 ornithine cyclodeaminase family protein [Phycicoccus sp. M110.8]